MAAVPDQPELGLPGDPGRARDRRHGRRAAAPGQALDRLPQARRPPAAGVRATCSCTGWSGSRSRCSSRRRSSSSPPGWPTPRSGTPGTSTSARPTTRWPGSPSGRCSCTSRSSCRSIRGALTTDVDSTALDRPTMAARPGVMSRRGLLRTTWAAAGRRGARDRRSDGALAAAGLGAGRPVRRRAGRACRSTTRRSTAGSSRPRPARRTGSPWRTATARRRSALADLRAMPQTTASLPDRLCRGLERRSHLDRRARARPARPRSARRPGARCSCESLQEHGGERVQLPRAGNFSDHPHTLLALRARRPAALARPRIPVPADRTRPAGRRLQTKWVGRLEVAS